MKKSNIELVFIIDRSGSMAGLESDTIGGYNQFLAKQDPKNDVKVSTFLFDHECLRLFDGVSIKEAVMTDKEYFVRGSTALLDAIGITVQTVVDRHKGMKEEDLPEKVIFVITTDGLENSSKEYSYPDIKKLISRRRLIDGWEFIFMGANLDVDAETARLGIDKKYSRRYESSKAGTQAMYQEAGNICACIMKEKE
jgi:hypothetical protein